MGRMSIPHLMDTCLLVFVEIWEERGDESDYHSAPQWVQSYYLQIIHAILKPLDSITCISVQCTNMNAYMMCRWKKFHRNALNLKCSNPLGSNIEDSAILIAIYSKTSVCMFRNHVLASWGCSEISECM